MRCQCFRRLVTVFLIVCGFSGAASAEDPKPKAKGAEGEKIQLRVTGEKAEGGGLVFRLGESSNFWLGVALEQENGRLEVEQLLPESPAAKAGIKPGDVLLASGETALKEVGELQKLVQSSEGKPLKLKVLRDGKETVVQVKPERREGVQTIVIGEGDEAGEGGKQELRKRLQQLIEQARKQAESGKNPPAIGWQLLRTPRAVNDTPFPANLEVTIKKKGNHPLRIKVRQDAQTWSVSEQELDKLPEPIRGHVARMLPGRAPATMWMPGARLMPGAPARPGAPLNPAPLKQPRLNPAPAAGGAPGQPLPGASVFRLESRTNNGELQKEVQQLKEQLQELREQVEALRKK